MGNDIIHGEEEQYDVILEDVDETIRPRKIKSEKKTQEKPRIGWQFASVAGQVGLDIALPMALGLIGGVKLDEQWGTRPKATIALFSLGLILSCASLIRIVRDAARKG